MVARRVACARYRRLKGFKPKNDMLCFICVDYSMISETVKVPRFAVISYGHKIFSTY